MSAPAPSPYSLAGRLPRDVLEAVAPGAAPADALEPAVVAWWNLERGFGEVTLGSGRTAFTMLSVLPGEGFRCLVPGEQVLVRTGPNPRKPGGLLTEELAHPADRHRGVVTAYDDQRGHGTIADDAGEEVFVHFSQVLHAPGVRAGLRPGEAVTFALEVAGGRGQARAVKQLDPRQGLERHCRISEEDLGRLAELAEEESWDFRQPDAEGTDGAGRATYPVLRSYVQHTFARLEEQGKVAAATGANGHVMVFNTGLVTENQEALYGYLLARAPGEAWAWRLEAWVKESDGRLAGLLAARPAPATYWEDPSVLFFDPRLPLILDWDHFVEDNLDRYPPDLRDKPVALMLTKAAVATARERVARNYKAAVPQYHRGEIQLLLPLCLRGTAEAQLALVVRRVGAEYHGETVLPLPGALRNARLLARPDRDWLNP
ncbi:DUF3825 domain-containing protein [Georgenia thermotolerans]|uniref:DUF3825 domain-containing protein n=1 Tax=Georgenia thermotolerans TaxID=527326 RepID=A0A7J5UMG3_9MICO|nr:DUF3825 domain-containing protein [Georgenia thermotolerans]KAE8763542.1 DUF3825 domain-containing protein [Georgenia thermotolerans]